MSVRDNDGVRTCSHGHAVRDFEELDAAGQPTGFMVPVAEECRLCPGGRAGIAFKAPTAAVESATVEEQQKTIDGVFDRVAFDPKLGDVVRFTGGHFDYEVVEVFEGRVVARRVESFRDGTETSLKMPVARETWADLVRLSCGVSRSEGGAS